ncbi:hypothetical protein [Chromobacterium violaceum]|uniref:hypothetical protein n=1 Tax=Chromobacterium violaceum TaxID=536 RepID=UPI0010553A7C|nr:hypothetical protein [Chromobacterium violaceum]MBT2869493.1 hypothetical protein [Chromobacterium violaceum]MCD0491789.1 hypothetical protein [Chromobacterium violaceum]QRO35170.1 hypothetical protein I6K04_10880 [Chromobacterium violaceum]QRQ15025.1 hypothetical protein I6K03_11850 [Chromobacterium violaceum]
MLARLTPCSRGRTIAARHPARDHLRHIMHTIKPRNPLACAAILKKGGAHGRSRSGLRQSQKHSLWAELEDWREERDRQPMAADRGQDADEAFFSAEFPKATGRQSMACCFWALVR